MPVRGALGVTNEMPFFDMMHDAAIVSLADRPTEVHTSAMARQVRSHDRPNSDVWLTERIPRNLEAARATSGERLEHEAGSP